MEDRRARLREFSRLITGDAYRSYIVPLPAGENGRAIEMSRRFREAGYWVMPVRYPTVPKGKARVRVSLSAALTADETENLPKYAKYWLTRDGNPGLILSCWAGRRIITRSSTSRPRGTICFAYTITVRWNRSLRRSFPPTGMSRFLHGRSGCGPPNGRAATLRRIGAVALGGTPYPVDDRFGIPRRAFLATLRGLRGSGAETINRRAYGADYDRLALFFDERPSEDKLDELGVLF